MNTINISKKKLDKLNTMDLPNCVFNTEGIIYEWNYRGKNEILKLLFNDTGVTFASKLYTVEMLNFYKEVLPRNFIIPDNLVSIGGKISGFTTPKFNGVNLAAVLNDKSFSAKEKIYYLTKIGETLNQLKSIRKYGKLKQIYLNDLHEANVLVDPIKKDLGFIDLDSCKILNNCSFASKYLGPNHFVCNKPYKYIDNIPENGPGYMIANENSDLYCYNVIILNYLFGGNITRLNLDEFYEYLNYLEKLKFDKKLLDSFNKLTMVCDNVNPVGYLETITEEQVGRAKKIVYDKCIGKGIRK